MNRALPIVLTAVALACAVVGVAGLAGPWWACIAAAVGILAFVLVTDFEGGNDERAHHGDATEVPRRR